MSTNGLMLEDYATALMEAGLKRVNVSLDTLDRETFHRVTGVDALEKVLAGIEAAVHAGLVPIKLNVVVQRGINDEECAALARMTLHRPYHVRFIEYMPVADYASWKRGHVPNTEVKKAIEEQMGPLKPLASGEVDGPALRYQIEGAAGTIGFISAITDEGFSGRCNRIRLTASGMLRPCLYSTSEIDLRTPLRSSCDDAALDALFNQALAIKPASHELSTRAEEKMLMTMIDFGG